MPVKCPNCRLVNPQSAGVCDCGYDFRHRRTGPPPEWARSPQKPVTSLLLTSVVLQVLAFVSSLLILGGWTFRVLLCCLAAHWALAGLIIERRSAPLTRTDEALLQFGFLFFFPPASILLSYLLPLLIPA